MSRQKAYKIIKKDNSSITSFNSRELKRRIKSSTKKYKGYTEGVYNFVNPRDPDEKVCFQVKYTFVPVGKTGRVIGEQRNKF